ncbi:MAG: ABC transporter ATP-binding protein [Nannocystaceae bacterium]
MQLVLRFVLVYGRRYVPQYALGLLLLVLTNYAVVRIPTLIGRALNVIEGSGVEALASTRALVVELMVWACVVVVVRTVSRILFFNPGREIEYRLGVDLFGHLLTLQRPFFLRRKVGELVSVATNDTQSVRLLVGFAGLQVCNVAVAIPMHVMQMLRTDAALTAWCLIPVLLGAMYMRSTIRRFHGLVKKSLEELGALSDRVLESYAGVSTVRAFGVEEAIVARFEVRNREFFELAMRVAKIRAFSMPALTFSGLIATAIVLWVGGDRVIAGELGVGDLATFTALLVSLVSTLTSLAWVLAAVSRGSAALRRVQEVLSTSDGLPPATSSKRVDKPPRLELCDLSFHYGEGQDLAISGISATVRPGGMLGIFGRTGAGKTTLIELLARLHTPPRGCVRLDGVDIVDIPLAELRRGSAVVGQHAFLFSTSLRDNICLRGVSAKRSPWRDLEAEAGGGAVAEAGAERGAEADAEGDAEGDAELERVLRAACLERDVELLPQGLDTLVGERGVMLSGGQRQRTALARALYRRPALLLLDDILSAVDQGTEAQLVAAIRSIRSGDGAGTPTTVIVSHRTSVLEQADEILVLDEGRVVERGTHAQLLVRGGLYADSHAARESGGAR